MSSSLQQTIRIGKKPIVDFQMPYVIAEVGSNHNGDMDLAFQLVDKAKACGCDAVKFQSWTPESLICQEEYERNQKYNDSPKKHFGSLKEMVEKYYLRTEQHKELKAYCDRVGITFVSTPFSIEEADLLETLDVPFYKIASMDINHTALLEHVAKKGKPVILSTGMSTLGEIDEAIKVIEAAGNNQIVLLHCIAIYPPLDQDIHLNNISTLRQAFNYPVGFSDHSKGVTIPLASVALGACVIEKHFTLDKDMPGWDHEVSADPQDMTVIVQESARIVKALGSFQRIVSQAEKEKKMKFRRSAVAKRDIPAGTVLTAQDIAFKRPATGIAPNHAHALVGRTLKSPLAYDQIIRWSDLV